MQKHTKRQAENSRIALVGVAKEHAHTPVGFNGNTSGKNIEKHAVPVAEKCGKRHIDATPNMTSISCLPSSSRPHAPQNLNETHGRSLERKLAEYRSLLSLSVVLDLQSRRKRQDRWSTAASSARRSPSDLG